jgi:hypothetical protein
VAFARREIRLGPVYFDILVVGRLLVPGSPNIKPDKLNPISSGRRQSPKAQPLRAAPKQHPDGSGHRRPPRNSREGNSPRQGRTTPKPPKTETNAPTTDQTTNHPTQQRAAMMLAQECPATKDCRTKKG